MSEVKKWYVGVYGGEAQARACSPAEFEIINEREGRSFVLAEDFDRVTAERDALQQRLTAADERIDERDGTCEWTREEDCGSWNSACGITWTFHDDGPAENGMHFCHSCGKTLVMADEDENDDD